MGLGETINSHPKVVVAVMVVVLIGAAVIVLRSGSGKPAGRSGSYYYDLSDGSLFTGAAGQKSVQTPTGGPAALAHVFSCGNCADSSTHFTGYLERYTDEALAAMASGSADAETAFRTGHLVALPDKEPRWTRADSSDGAAVQNAALAKCAEAHECLPQ